MPMFIYHYMILNIIVNVPARGGADGFLPYYMGNTGSAGQGEPEVFSWSKNLSPFGCV